MIHASCICDPSVLELIRGVQLHFNALTQFPEVASFVISGSYTLFYPKCMMLLTWFNYTLNSYSLVTWMKTVANLLQKKMKKAKSVPLLNYEFRGCMVEDLKKGRTKKHAASLMDMANLNMHNSY